MPVRPDPKNPYDANSAKFTTREKSVTFETAMLYFSDHGESLGEHNLYLHGYPYALAPIEQKHIPAIFWFGQRFPIERAKIRATAGDPYSHDNLFHTLLGLYDVKTKAYQAKLDMVSSFVTASGELKSSAPVVTGPTR